MYGRRALRRRTSQPDHSPPRKRQKVFVEIISPKRKTYSPPPCTPEKPPHSGNRGSIVKRMLGRSKTESSMEATPSTSVPVTTTSIAPQASSHSLPTFQDRETTPEPSSQSSPKPLPIKHIRTYAGSSRSFLVALPLPEASPSKTVEDDTEPHESYTDLRTRWGIDLSEDDPLPHQEEQETAPTPLKRNPSDVSQFSLPAGMMNDLKSITELRSKGESRRFLDEVGYLFEGLDCSSAIGLRRTSALEIVNKLCDPSFNRRAKTSDFYSRTWNKFRGARAGSTDKIFDATVAFFAALAARDPRTLIEVAQQKEFVSTLVEILSSLDHRKDVLTSVLASSSDNDLKSHGILQAEIAALKLLAKLVSNESSLFSVNQPSARFLISHSLASLPPSLLADHHLPTLLASLRAELEFLEPRIAAYQSSLSLLPSIAPSQSSIPSLYHIEACLRLLDSHLLGHWSSANSLDDHSSSGLSHLDGFTSELMSLCVASASSSTDSEQEMDIARRCLCGAMRVLTLLSHNDPWWCSAASDVPYALPFAAMIAMRSQARWSASRCAEPQQSSIEAFDLLCLALGLVMNWATLSPPVATLSRIKSINPACPGTRACISSCHCPDQTSVLACFATLHAQYADHHPEDPPEYTFLRGYTAILLGLLIRDNPANQSVVLSTLPGISHSERIQSLIGHCRSFLDLYNDTLPRPSASPRATPEADQAVQADRRRATQTWDKQGDHVARTVIASLETLCAT